MESTRWLRQLAPLTFIVLLLFTTTSHSISTNNDLATLLSFRSLIIKDPLRALSSWNALGNSTSNGTHGFCRWAGVTCRGGLYPDRVTSLHLRGLGLVGAISPLLGNLTRLRVLDLSDNKLEGEIPPSLGNCFALRKLNLSANLLSGTIPSTMGHLSKLVILNIRNNNISGLVPSSFANLTALTFFSISDNYVHGEIPPWLGNLTVLTHLNIAVNMMGGHVPPVLAKLTYLEYLTIAVNKFDGVIQPSLFNISSLEVLDLGSNQLSGSLPPDMGFTLPNLREFFAFYNKFEGKIPASLSNISLLGGLVFHGNRFRGPIPPNVGIYGLLTDFDVGNNELEATKPRDWDFLTSLANCSNLIHFNLQLNNLSGVLPNTISNLSQELQYMGLGGNQIAGHIPTGIGRYHKLTNLEFADNLFTGTIPSDIGKLSNLHELVLFQNRFHGEIPSSLDNITQLNLFQLSTNYLEGKIPVSLGNLSKLTSFDISNNRLSGQIPQEIINISSLTQLFDLSNNVLSGHISPQIGHLVNLGTIDLSSNKLSGEIPNTLGGCLELQFLYLEGNLLQGQIPKDLSALRGLEVLDLSDNKLSGPIPEFLESFHLLRSLNLSFNQLSGPVPKKGIFSNASSVSLAGNNALCGGPLFFHFPACPSLAPVSPARHQLLEILIFSVVGASVFVIICTAACYCVKKIRAGPGSPNRDLGSTFLTVIYQRISYAELHVATDSFSSQNLIGRGSFSSVYKGTLSCGVVAVKVLDLRQRGASSGFMSECNALKRIQHRKLVKVITVCDSLDHNGVEFKALVLEFISNGSLDEWLHPSIESTENTHGILNVVQRLNIALDVAEALEYLHHHINPSIVHCDIKPSNILLDDDMIAHVGDFGLAKIMNAEASVHCLSESSSVRIKGTIGYLAPEYGIGTGISTEGDIFSYGVLLLEILTGRRPTDASFYDATSLPKYVETAFPDKLLEIMDSSMPHNGNIKEIIELFVAPVSRLGLACCRDSPRQRMKMGEVVKELTAIKKACERKFGPFVDQ
ncbi:probable LRR receptor-like serine/threonine-protein kinase At3g47570 [Phragmites australis]|uniref:probable LRR receptor-like serine/threonine-protein kinase At3g47570 n=1 Tax=Phragmites australis TaxID=29695 RepID=UPI002D795BDA|nr:probable LRR receptor-like serine/threonine-protein kinase At3g47570 [Phragmites australis]